jgi:hypothetical protein
MPCWCKTTCKVSHPRSIHRFFKFLTRVIPAIPKVICEHCPYVQFFDGHGTGKAIKSHDISNLAIRHVAARCPHLQRVTLQSSPQLTDAVLLDFAHHCPHLRYCNKPRIGCTHVGLQRLLEGCSKLEELRIYSYAVGLPWEQSLSTARSCVYLL